MAVLLSPVGGVAAQFFTNAGVPLSGGKIYTYAAGTSTPQATYTTGAGNVQHSNPIVLDAAGRVPTGEIWLTDGLSYKFVLKDNNDVLIATYDNIVGINSNFVNFVNQQEIQTATASQTVFNLTTMEYQPGIGNLSVFVDGVNQYGPGAQYAYTETDSNTVTFVSGLHVGASVKFTTTEIQNSGIGDASQITYTYPAVDAVQESVEDRLAQYVSVKDFGAVGDGVTDDTAAFEATVGLNKTVFVPAGNYKITSSIVIPDSCFTKYVGEADIPVPASKITIDFDGPAFTSASGNTSFYSFENIIVTVNNPTTKTNTAFVKDEGNAVHCDFKNLVLQYCQQPAISLTAGFVCCFDHVLIQYCYNYGIKVATGSDNRFVRCLADHTDGGGMDLFGSGYVIDNYYTENCCRRNDPATFDETWYDLKLSGANHTVVGGLISAYPQNDKAPILLSNSLDTSFIGMRGFALGTGAPSYVLIAGSDGGVVFQQSESLTYSGYERNVIQIKADGGSGSYPDITLGQDASSLWSGSARAWACFNGTDGTLKQSQGVQSITKNGTGDYTVNFYTDTFSNANYVVNANAFGSGVSLTTTISAKLSTSVRFFLLNSVTGANVDSVDVMVSVNGI